MLRVYQLEIKKMFVFQRGVAFSRWGMAERLLIGSKLPEEALVTTYIKTIRKLEGMSRPIPSTVKRKIFRKLALPNLIRLRSAHIAETFNSVLGQYTPRELKNINNEMEKTGDDINSDLHINLQLRLLYNKTKIENRVWHTAEELSDRLMLDTIEALRKEGIDIW